MQTYYVQTRCGEWLPTNLPGGMYAPHERCVKQTDNRSSQRHYCDLKGVLKTASRLPVCVLVAEDLWLIPHITVRIEFLNKVHCSSSSTEQQRIQAATAEYLALAAALTMAPSTVLHISFLPFCSNFYRELEQISGKFVTVPHIMVACSVMEMSPPWSTAPCTGVDQCSAASQQQPVLVVHPRPQALQQCPYVSTCSADCAHQSCCLLAAEH